MIRFFPLLFILILYSIVGLYASDNTINWHDSLDEALDEAKFADIPVMINISTDFRDLDKNVFSKDKFMHSAKDFVSLKLNGQSKASIEFINKLYGINDNRYTIYIDPNTMEVLSRLESSQFSQSNFLSSMQKAIDTRSIIEDIKNAKVPTIEALDFYINQNDVDTAYKIVLDAIKNNNKIHSIAKNLATQNFSEKLKAEYFNKIANIYLKQYDNYRKAIEVYLSLIRYCPSEKDQVMSADSKIIEIYQSRNNTDGIINHINQILSRPNTHIKYKEHYLDMVIEIENQYD